MLVFLIALAIGRDAGIKMGSSLKMSLVNKFGISLLACDDNQPFNVMISLLDSV